MRLPRENELGNIIYKKYNSLCMKATNLKIKQAAMGNRSIFLYITK